jgi:hypothetical protein
LKKLLLILFAGLIATTAHAEQKTVFCSDAMKAGPYDIQECREKCHEFKCDLPALARDGWKILSSHSQEKEMLQWKHCASDYEKMKKNLFYVKGTKEYGCNCCGQEYILERQDSSAK